MLREFNNGYHTMFKEGQLSLGLFFPLESYLSDVPKMEQQEELAVLAEDAGFKALWFRDVPLRDHSFGDVGQIYDPLVYLSWIAAQTSKIALATGSIILPFRHPIHLSKSMVSIDQLSGGRVVMGLASGDRPIEFPAFGVDRDNRGPLYAEHFETLQKLSYESYPVFSNSYGSLSGADTIPKARQTIPLLTTGYSQQDLSWIAKHSDGWISYPRAASQQAKLIQDWQQEVQNHSEQKFKPFAQSLYIDLHEDPTRRALPIHLGFSSGRVLLIDFLNTLRDIGVNHVALNLRYAKRPIREVIQEMGEEVLPHFF